MVSAVEDPHLLHRKLVDLAPMHFKKGVKAAYMPHMFKVLNSVLTKVLGTQYIEKYKESWVWIWVFLTASMEQSLTDASASSQVCVDVHLYVSRHPCDGLKPSTLALARLHTNHYQTLVEKTPKKVEF